MIFKIYCLVFQLIWFQARQAVATVTNSNNSSMHIYGIYWKYALLAAIWI